MLPFAIKGLVVVFARTAMAPVQVVPLTTPPFGDPLGALRFTPISI